MSPMFLEDFFDISFKKIFQKLKQKVFKIISWHLSKIFHRKDDFFVFTAKHLGNFINTNLFVMIGLYRTGCENREIHLRFLLFRLVLGRKFFYFEIKKFTDNVLPFTSCLMIKGLKFMLCYSFFLQKLKDHFSSITEIKVRWRALLNCDFKAHLLKCSI